MRESRFFLLAATFAFVQLSGGVAEAQRDRGPLDAPYFAAKLLLGLGGEVELEGADDDLLMSYGAGLEYMHPLHD